MKLALIGCDDETLAFVRALTASGRHVLTSVFDVAPAWKEPLRQVAPQAVWGESWEGALANSQLQGVIVAADRRDEVRADQLRKLVQEAVPLVLVHPACEMIMAIELDMIRQDTHCVMVSHFPGLRDPAITRLNELCRNTTGPLGRIEQITMQRCLPQRTRTDVWRQFARDAVWLRQLLGEVTRVSATASSATADAFTTLDVFLFNEEQLTARWSLAPTREPSDSELAVIGSSGQAVVHLSLDHGSINRCVVNGIEEPVTAVEAEGEVNSSLAEIEKGLMGKESQPQWLDICRALEVVDAAERSVARGRAIDLQHGPVTEQATFKSVMAAGGCLLLLLALGVFFFFAVFEGIRMANNHNTAPPSVSNAENGDANTPPSNSSPLLYWPVCLATPFVIFLLLQFLQLVFPTKDRKSG